MVIENTIMAEGSFISEQHALSEMDIFHLLIQKPLSKLFSRSIICREKVLASLEAIRMIFRFNTRHTAVWPRNPMATAAARVLVREFCWKLENVPTHLLYGANLNLLPCRHSHWVRRNCHFLTMIGATLWITYDQTHLDLSNVLCTIL